ncbi:MAG TPA: radical SAM protein [Candidatus Nanoarchaeia archaeon]|nr:radical SAM protein [Candidatus Nanoarchaeia archaeon]
MVAGILFREERENGGFKFDRETGKAEFFDEKSFPEEIMKSGKKGEHFDVVFKPAKMSKIALTAPLAVWHETTEACNLDCKPCGQVKSGEKELEVGQIKDIYAGLSSAGVFEVRITGGEACIRKDISDIVLAARDSGLYVSLTSNGVYNERLRKRVAELPIGLYIISLDGTERVNDLVRGEGAYASTLSTLKELAGKGKNVRVNTILMRQNKDCIEELVKVLEDSGVSALTLIPLRPVGTALGDFYANKLTPEEYMRAVARVNEIREQHPNFSISTNYDILSANAQGANTPSYWSKMCIAGIEAACISPAGNLRACILHKGEEYNVGNLTESTLTELWHNDALWGIFRDLNRRVLDQCKACDDYTLKCPGSCLAMTEFSKSPEEVYCFKPLLAAK